MKLDFKCTSSAAASNLGTQDVLTQEGNNDNDDLRSQR